jgi:hypothetical protein
MEVTPATFDVLLHRAMAALKKTLAPEQNSGNRKPDGYEIA